MTDAAPGLVGGWSPGIGDPSLAGWLTVVAYFVTAWQARRSALRISPGMATLREARRERAFWWVIAGSFVLLGVNKQLDVQSLFTEIGRMLARSQGWYEGRRAVQLVFILFVGLVGVLAAGIVVALVRNASSGARLAALGTALVVTFVLVRAASFHHVDELIGSEWLGLRANWLLELGGIGVTFAGTQLQKKRFERRR